MAGPGGRIIPVRRSHHAHIFSATMFLSVASTINIASSVDEILSEIRGQIHVLLPR